MIGGAAVQRDRDEQVEGDLAPVVADEPAAGAVDLAGVELGHERRCPSRASRPASCADAIGLVNAPSSGVA